MGNRYAGPEFMEPYFYPCPSELRELLPEHNAYQGIQCPHGHKQLSVLKRVDLPVVFAQCELCNCKFKVYANGDYAAGYISDDSNRLLSSLKCKNCGEQVFEIAVGYEYPGDEIDSTDISWFTLVGKCLKCETIQELFADETA